MKSLPPSSPDKRALRHTLLDVRRSVDESERAKWDIAIGAQLEQWLDAHPVDTLGIYWSIQKEPDLLPTYLKLAARGVQLLLPVTMGKGKPLKFAAWTPGDTLMKDSFGVPVPEQQVFGSTPPALLIPCVGFNADRFRLGYGGGFYDRTLALVPKSFAIGIAYSCQRTDFDISTHDIPLDMIVTELSVQQ